ncbi:hypothetical protein GGH16_001154 [Coemansia sp. RSA 560]|nr:hypothetical protein GGH16_001154 [Coemansia sp. RSA 560]
MPTTNLGARGAGVERLIDQTKVGAESNRLCRRSPYTSTIPYQFIQLFRRETAIMWGSRYTLAFRTAYQLIFAAIVGALFNQLPETTDGAFLRSGVLFFALLFSTLVAQAEMVAAVSGRLVTYKQKSLSMFHPGVLALVQTVADMVPNFITIALFSLILYEAAGLTQTAGQFFAFLLFLLSGCLCLTAMFRLIDLNYTVLVKSGYRQLLNNIAGVIRPSQTTTQIDSTFNEYAMGDEYLVTLSWRFTHRWRNFGIMIGFLVFNIAFVMFIVKVNKR